MKFYWDKETDLISLTRRNIGKVNALTDLFLFAVGAVRIGVGTFAGAFVSDQALAYIPKQVYSMLDSASLTQTFSTAVMVGGMAAGTLLAPKTIMRNSPFTGKPYGHYETALVNTMMLAYVSSATWVAGGISFIMYPELQRHFSELGVEANAPVMHDNSGAEIVLVYK